MTKIPVHKGLYDPSEDIPSLIGSRCAQCDTNHFPPLMVGCDHCGHTELALVPLKALGTVHAAATVYLHQGEDIETPFTLAEVALDDGPLIRALLTEVIDHDVIGVRATGEWVCVKETGEGHRLVEPRFRLLWNEGVSA